MKQRILLPIALTAVAVFAASLSFGAVANTKHDMAAMGRTVGGVAERGVCSYCHVPHGAQGSRLWAGTPETTYGTVANLCATCHLSDAVTDSTNESRRMFESGAHGFSRNVLRASDRYAQGVNFAATAPEYWSDADGSIECSSCHDPHTNTATQRPFLRVTLVGGDGLAGAAGLCETCHGVGRRTGGLGSSNSNGETTAYSQHPVGSAYDGSTTAPVTWTTPYRQAADLTNGSTSAQGKWTIGGHTHSGSTSAGGVVCVTCHIVHGEDPANVAGGALPDNDLLVNSKFGGLCEDCHTTNPGAASTTGHPVSGDTTYRGTLTGNDLVVNATGVTATAPSAGYMAGVGLQCLSCHDIHYGENNTPMFVDSGTTASNYCTECHTGTIITNRLHHPAPTTLADTRWARATYNAVANTGGFYPGSGAFGCMTCHRAHNGVEQGLPGTADFILRALNYDSTNGQPTSAICVACHTTNPGAYAFDLDGGPLGNSWEMGSHVVSPALAGDLNTTAIPASFTTINATGNGYVTGAVPGKQTNGPSGMGNRPMPIVNWTQGTGDHAGSNNTNSFSKYGNTAFSWTTGATASTTAGIICESCHSITNPRENGLASSGTNASFLLLGNWDDSATARRNTGDNTAGTTATAAITANGGDGLCLGCHGIPGGTHPTTGLTVSRTGAVLNTDTSDYANASGTGEAYYPTADELVCGSCHDVHDATVSGGFYILKTGNTGGEGEYGAGITAAAGVTDATDLNFTPLCHACHTY